MFKFSQEFINKIKDDKIKYQYLGKVEVDYSKFEKMSPEVKTIKKYTFYTIIEFKNMVIKLFFDKYKSGYENLEGGQLQISEYSNFEDYDPFCPNLIYDINNIDEFDKYIEYFNSILEIRTEDIHINERNINNQRQ